MTALWRSLLPARRRSERTIATIDDYALAVGAIGLGGYPMGGSPVTTTYGGQTQTVESVGVGLQGYAQLFGRNGVIYSCMAVRLSVFSTIRFQYQRINRGRPSELFGAASLAPLELPWIGGTTQDLLARMIQDVDLCGNSYWSRTGDELVRLRPDWVQTVMRPRMLPRGRDGAPVQVGWERLGYAYWEGGIGTAEPAVFLVDEVAHFAPMPDPLASYRGMSWLTPIVREATSDGQMEQHRAAFFEHAATPNMVVSLDKEIRFEAFKRFVSKMELDHKGVENAYKTMYLGGGADVTVVGADFQQMDFTKVQGHAETRIAAAAGVPPVIVGLSEGLQAATYSNYAQARRRFADGTLHPLWQNAAGSLSTLVPPPPGSSATNTPPVRLYYDARDVPFLREDRKDAVGIVQAQAATVRTLIEAGYEPDAAIAFVSAEDLGLLMGRHSGLTSVQLQEPGADGGGSGEASSAGGAATEAAAAAETEPAADVAETPAEIRLLMEMIQKVYLGVNKVLTAEEARALLNRGGAKLPDLPPDHPMLALPPVEPADATPAADANDEPAEPEAEAAADDQPEGADDA